MMILIAGTDGPLLEGISQAIAALGHPVRTASSLEEARDVAPPGQFDIAIVQRALLAGAAPVPLRPGGVFVLFRGRDDAAAKATLSPGLARLLLAEVELPLERQRLVALVRATLARLRAPQADRPGLNGGDRDVSSER
ncbi:MAG: hypothetical protein ACT4R6_14225 [Gemmatimonadaceae bacterium]